MSKPTNKTEAIEELLNRLAYARAKGLDVDDIAQADLDVYFKDKPAKQSPFDVADVQDAFDAYVNDEPEEQSPSGEWVALLTCCQSSDEEDHGMFWEAGGIYPEATKPQNSATRAARPFEASEHEAVCPRCGQRFAATEHGTAESHRDLHFDGDEDIPSICRDMPSRPRGVLRKVEADEKGHA